MQTKRKKLLKKSSRKKFSKLPLQSKSKSLVPRKRTRKPKRKKMHIKQKKIRKPRQNRKKR